MKDQLALGIFLAASIVLLVFIAVFGTFAALLINMQRRIANLFRCPYG